jgi:hypothetical protein
MTRARLVLVGALVVAIAACGSSGGSKGGGTSTTTEDSLAADRALATTAVIRPEDLPGFSASPRSGDGEVEIQDLAAGIPGCEELVAGKRDGRVRVKSPKFTQGAVSIDEDVSVYGTKADLAAQLELYRSPSIIGCLQALYEKAVTERLPPNATIQDVSVSPIAVENVGDGQFGFRLTVNLTESGTPETLYSDIVGVSVGRVGVSLTVMADEVADLAQAESHLVPLIAHRVENAER